MTTFILISSSSHPISSHLIPISCISSSFLASQHTQLHCPVSGSSIRASLRRLVTDALTTRTQQSRRKSLSRRESMVGPRAMRLCARLAPGRGSVVPVASTIAGPVSAFSTSTSTAFSTSTCTASTTAGTNHCSNHRFSHRLSHRPSHRPSVTSGASSSLALASRERTASFRTWTVLMAGKESDLGLSSLP